MISFKEQCISLRQKDYSLDEIAKITGKPKTSVYYHVRDMSLSPARLKRRHEQNLRHLVQLANGRRGKSSRSFTKFSRWSPEKVALVAHLLFDGEIGKRGCFYNNRNKVLLERVERYMGDIYVYPPAHYHNPHTGVRRVSYFNVALGGYLRQKSQELLAQIQDMPQQSKRAFLVAFFDDEGCMDFRPSMNSRRIRGYQKNTRILELVSSLLSDFSIKSRIQKPNEVVISGRTNLVRFQKEINFSAGVTVNGNRSNSTWKKHIEKRELLRRAIDSYINV